MKQFDTPILYLIFNRPDLCEITFERIREIKPKYLFIAADGPRKGNNADAIKCENSRDYVLSQINWDCELKTLFREENLGCKYAVSSAIDWFFENVEQGIILEDDCLPNNDFFQYCENALLRYKNQKDVVHISGNKFSNIKLNESTFFSKYIHIWGWATWRDRWQHYSDISSWKKDAFDELIYNTFRGNKRQIIYWGKIFSSIQKNRVDSWGYLWTFACWKDRGVSLNPAKNLVENIGFRDDGTHLLEENPKYKILTENLNKPICFPDKIQVNTLNDDYVGKFIFADWPLKKRVVNRLRLILFKKTFFK